MKTYMYRSVLSTPERKFPLPKESSLCLTTCIGHVVKTMERYTDILSLLAAAAGTRSPASLRVRNPAHPTSPGMKTIRLNRIALSVFKCEVFSFENSCFKVIQHNLTLMCSFSRSRPCTDGALWEERGHQSQLDGVHKLVSCNAKGCKIGSSQSRK